MKLRACDFTFPSLPFLLSRNLPSGICLEVLVIYGLTSPSFFYFPSDGSIELEEQQRLLLRKNEDGWMDQCVYIWMDG